jgi:hypothetical protein
MKSQSIRKKVPTTTPTRKPQGILEGALRPSGLLTLRKKTIGMRRRGLKRWVISSKGQN